MLGDVRRLLTLREELSSEESRLSQRRAQLARRYLDEQTERVLVPRDEFESWLDRPGLEGGDDEDE